METVFNAIILTGSLLAVWLNASSKATHFKSIQGQSRSGGRYWPVGCPGEVPNWFHEGGRRGKRRGRAFPIWGGLWSALALGSFEENVPQRQEAAEGAEKSLKSLDLAQEGDGSLRKHLPRNMQLINSQPGDSTGSSDWAFLPIILLSPCCSSACLSWSFLRVRSGTPRSDSVQESGSLAALDRRSHSWWPPGFF